MSDSVPNARDFLLRAEASRVAGHLEFAQDDLRSALAIDPCDPLTNERLMKWGSLSEQEGAALRLIENDAVDNTLLARAVAVVLARGAPAICRLRRQQDSVVGWIAWSSLRPLTLRIRREATAEFTLELMPSHPMTGPATSAAEVEILDETGLLVGLDFFLGGRMIGGWTLKRAPTSFDARSFSAKSIDAPSSPSVSIIVPVYEDLEATKACLRSVFQQNGEIATRLFLVDDCSPNAALRAYLEDEASRRDLSLLQNETNVGFAASVNRALQHCPVGDVLLLNADTQLPNGAIDRLFAASNTDENIGTVTPLSNNGEFASFPAPNIANPLPSCDGIALTDRLAAIANRDQVVDLPNGIGFCLYIKRACLNAVGPLSEIYQRGYYEDVEFCLRARERGFRNVCATGVFVAHAGAKSFRQDKRALVVRNLRILEERFPNYTGEFAAFLHADPLKAARSAIELLTPIDRPVALLVSSAGLPRAIAGMRAEQLDAGVCAIYCTYSPYGRTVELKNKGGETPQSLVFALDREADVATLRSYIDRLDIRQIELFDYQSIPITLLSQLSQLRTRIDVICANLEWCSPSFAHCEGPCPGLEPLTACDACLFTPMFATSGRTHKSKDQQRIAKALDLVDSIKPLDRMADAFARRAFANRLVVSDVTRLAIKQGRTQLSNDHSLAILVPFASGLIDRQIISVCRRLVQDDTKTKIVVLGRCVNDLAVMATGNVFVTGEIKPHEYPRLVIQYRLSALMSPYRTCFFGLLDKVAHESVLPKAYFDWSFAALEIDDEDLALDPRVCDESAASSIADWLKAISRPPTAQ